jgi:hypothetical protein
LSFPKRRPLERAGISLSTAMQTAPTEEALFKVAVRWVTLHRLEDYARLKCPKRGARIRQLAREMAADPEQRKLLEPAA